MLDLEAGLIDSPEGFSSSSSSSELSLWSLMLSAILFSFCLSCCSSKSASSHWGKGDVLFRVGGACWVGKKNKKMLLCISKDHVWLLQFSQDELIREGASVWWCLLISVTSLAYFTALNVVNSGRNMTQPTVSDVLELPGHTGKRPSVPSGWGSSRWLKRVCSGR